MVVPMTAVMTKKNEAVNSMWGTKSGLAGARAGSPVRAPAPCAGYQAAVRSGDGGCADRRWACSWCSWTPSVIREAP